MIRKNIFKFLVLITILSSCTTDNIGLTESKGINLKNNEKIILTEDIISWNKILLENTHNLNPSDIKIDKDNTIYVLGYGYNLVNDNSGFDWFIKKYNSNGVEYKKWNKYFDGNNGDDFPRSMIIDEYQNIYIEGYGQNITSSSSGADLWIKKFDKDGNEDLINWNKKIQLNNTMSSPRKNGLILDSINNLYVITTTNEEYNEHNIRSSWLIKKFNQNGIEDNLNWNKVIGKEKGYNWPLYINIDRNNNIYVSGVGDNISNTNNDGTLNYDWWIKKYSSDGQEDLIYWDKKIDGNKNWDWAFNTLIDDLDNVYICGTGSNLITETSSYDWWIKKFDRNGNEIINNWNKIIGNDKTQENLYAAILDENNNLIIGGAEVNITDNTESSIVRIITSNGKETEEIINIQNETEESNSLWDMEIDSENNLYILGTIFKYSDDESYSTIYIKKYYID